MKKTNYFVMSLLAAAATFSSCSNDDVAQNGGDVKGDALYMTLQFTSGTGHQTRSTVGDDGIQKGTVAESTISSGTIFLADPTGKVVFSKYVSDLIPEGGQNESETGNYQTKPIEVAINGVSTGTKYNVYFVANKNVEADSKNFTTTSTWETTAKDGEREPDFATNNKFWMFNQNDKNVAANQYQVEFIAANTDEKNPARIKGDKKIMLDRIAAQIATISDVTTITSDKADVKDVIGSVKFDGFALLNGAKTTYWEQNWGDDKFSTFTTPKTDFYSQYAYYAIGKDDTNTPTDNKRTFGTGNIYCLENNDVEGKANYTNNTTGLYYKYSVTLSDKLSKKDFKDNTFYMYNSTIFASLEALESQYNNVFKSKNTNATTALAEIQDEEGKIKSADLPAFRKKYDIKVYEGGVMYYTYFIKDKNYKYTEPDYAVLRNTYYTLTVKSLLNVGEDIPGGWEPTPKPVDPENYYLQIEVSANPWVLSNEQIELK